MTARRFQIRNLVHSALLIAAMAALAGLAAAAALGPGAAPFAIGVVALVLICTPAAPKELALSVYRARPLSRAEFPGGYALVEALARRADLPAAPKLYYVPSVSLNAFAVGDPKSSAVALTDGMLRSLSPRELAGVIGHEVSHIAHRDLWVLGVADALSRFTAALSYLGLALLALFLPLALLGAPTIHWSAPLLLAAAPSVMALLQLALSRTREFDADRGAARLTGDPLGLAAALAKVERRSRGFWEQLLFPYRPTREPSLLRSHPPTEDRIARLKRLAAERPQRPLMAPAPVGAPPFAPVSVRPRWRWTGVWW